MNRLERRRYRNELLPELLPSPPPAGSGTPVTQLFESHSPIDLRSLALTAHPATSIGDLPASSQIAADVEAVSTAFECGSCTSQCRGLSSSVAWLDSAGGEPLDEQHCQVDGGLSLFLPIRAIVVVGMPFGLPP